MFEIWLKKNAEIVDEIIEESNLKEIVKKKIDEFMLTEEFEQFLEVTLANEVKAHIKEYAEYYMIGDNGWSEIQDRVQSIIRRKGNKR